MTSELQHGKKRRLNYLKCHFCRASKKKCEPTDRKWPDQKCYRCVEEGLDCSENQLAGGKSSTPAEPLLRPVPAIEPTVGASDWGKVHDMSLRVTWLSQLIRYRDSVRLVEEYLMLSRPERQCEGEVRVNELRQYIFDEQASILADISVILGRTYNPGPILASFWSLFTTASALGNSTVNGNQTITEGAKDIESSDLVNRFLRIGDIGEALRMQEIIVVHMLQHDDDYDSIRAQSHLYINIQHQCTDRLSKAFPSTKFLGFTPPLHNLLLASGSRAVLLLHPQNEHETDMFQRSLTSLAFDMKIGQLDDFDFGVHFRDIWQRSGLHILSFWDKVPTWLYHQSVIVTHLNQRDCKGRTALHIASARGHSTLVIWLIEQGADTSIEDDGGHTPLWYAVASGCTATTAVLLKEIPRNVSTEFLFPAIDSGNPVVVDMIMSRFTGDAREGLDLPILSYLQRAIIMGHEDVVDQLIRRYPIIYKKDENGHTVLSYAAKENKDKIVALLIYNHGAGVTEVEHRDKEGFTPLMRASHSGYDGIVSVLLNSGEADINNQDYKYSTSLHHSARMGHGSIVKMLLKKGADVNSRDDRGWTALFIAVEGGRVDLVKDILNAGADLELKDDMGRTVFDINELHPHSGILTLLKGSQEIRRRCLAGNDPDDWMGFMPIWKAAD